MQTHPVADPFKQPAQVPLDIEEVIVGSRRLPVQQTTVLEMPFCTLRAYGHAELRNGGSIFFVPPLSGHYPVLFRDLILGLIQNHKVYVAEWTSARHVRSDYGAFTFEDNIAYIARMLEAVGPKANVLSICQSVVPTLAAASFMIETSARLGPRSMIFMAGPVDPLANPTRVVDLLRQRSLEWFIHNVIQEVPAGCPGQGRLVYPAHIQLSGLLSYLTRHVIEGGELARKLADDDGAAPITHPFLTLFSTVMDLAAEVFLENIETVFHERRLLRGGIGYRGRVIAPECIQNTGLMTIEAEDDDIAAPGQTYAAHQVCRKIPDRLREHLLLRGAGHFSLFHGETFREFVLPEINQFISSVSADCSA